MNDFQTNPWIFAGICFGWLIVIALFGASKVFWNEYQEKGDEGGKSES